MKRFLTVVLIAGGCLQAGCRVPDLHGLDDLVNRILRRQEKPKSPVLAWVGTVPITLEDYQSAERARGTNPIPVAPNPQILMSLIDRQVLKQMASRLNLDSDAVYRERIEAAHFEILRTRILERIGVPSDAEIESYYKQHREDFQARVELRAERLQFSSQASAAEALQMFRAGTPVEKVLDKLMKRGYLQNAPPTPLIKGKMDPALERVLSEAPVGQYAGVVKIGKTYEVVRKFGEIRHTDQSLALAKPGIRNLLSLRKINDYITQARKAAHVEIIPLSSAPAAKAAQAPAPTGQK